MTRKHYKLIAAALEASKPTHHNGSAWIHSIEQWEHDVKAIADALASDNAAFDRARFIKAVGA